MRTLRTLIGLLLALIGAGAIVAGGAAWSAMSHRDAEGRFSTTLTSIHTDGYAVVVPDVAAQVERYGMSGLLGAADLRIGVGGASQPLLLGIAPFADLDRYLAGVARTTVIGVGSAEGVQPVATAGTGGTAVPAPALRQTFWRTTSTASVEWSSDAGAVTGLAVMRADGKPGLDVALTVSYDAGWLTLTTWALLVGGLLCLFGGVGLIFWPTAAREMVLVLEAHRMMDFADRIAERAGRRSRPLATGSQRVPLHDLTGELVPVEPPQRSHRWRGTDPHTSRRDVVAANRRYGRAPREASDGVDEPTGESPYVSTAT